LIDWLQEIDPHLNPQIKREQVALDATKFVQSDRQSVLRGKAPRRLRISE